METSTRVTLADLLIYKESPLRIKLNNFKEKPKGTPDYEDAFVHKETSQYILIQNPVITRANVKNLSLKLDIKSNYRAAYATLGRGIHDHL